MSETTTTTNSRPGLELEDLEVAYQVRGRDRAVIRGVSLKIEQGEAYGLVGESGCGKTTAALAIVGYLPRNGGITGGNIRISGTDVGSLSRGELRQLRISDVSMVYQNPGSALNPSLRIGKQVAQAFAVYGVNGSEAFSRAEDALRQVQIADPGSVMDRYPHQLSGGMQQRVVIAMALANDPSLLVLDEPTTSLDATVEAEVLDLIAQLQSERNTTVLFITHNLSVIERMCDRVGVLYAGRLVEEGPVETVLHDPHHPYTVGLLRCIPPIGMRKGQGRLDTIPGSLPSIGEELPACVFADRCGLAAEICRAERPDEHRITPVHSSWCHFHTRARQLPREPLPDRAVPVERSADPLLQASGVSKIFRAHGHEVHALSDVSLSIWPGETLGLVGESGSGKSTLGLSLIGLVAPSGGTISLDGNVLPSRVERRTRRDVRRLQIVFQNPQDALNRRHTVRKMLHRSLKRLAGTSGAEAESRTLELASAVRLSERHLIARPDQLSGGLKQRVAIARAFAGNPELVVCDEPTSALDVSVQAAILNLLVDLQTEQQVAYLFISHDLAVVHYIADRIAVLYLGRLMEIGPAEKVFRGPHHPYTEALLSAVASGDGPASTRIRLAGEIPSATSPPPGCVFHTRCHRKLGSVCETAEPPLLETEDGHFIRCHIPVQDLPRMDGDAGEREGTPASQMVDRVGDAQ
jgi:peptide/nickel transport system ATP-binding protein